MHSTWRGIVAGLLALAALAAVPALQADDSNCLMCHRDQAVKGFGLRAHGLGADPRGEQAAIGCTDCHGASEAHAASPRAAPDFTFHGEQAGTGDEACLSCHSDAGLGHWAFSEHAGTDTGCVACHSLHTPTDPIQETGGEFAVCTSCHQQEKHGQMKFSRHPMQEGLVKCSDCHAPHGGAAMNGLVQPTVNETCYQCHAEKRGPFLFEHEPVQDDCTHCHDPHASVNDQLLTARQPFLCQQCHIASRHPGTLYDDDRLGGRDINIIGQSCTNCHSQVHGGNQPASSTFRR